MEAFIRPESTTELDEITFQILSWEAFDETEDPDGEYPDTRYNIYAFGVNKESESVCVRFDGYKPYFFALIPDKYQDTFDTFKRKEVEKYIRNKLFRNKEDLESVSVVTRKKYKGFTNEKEYKFLRFICKNLTTFNKIKWILNPKDTRKLPKISSISPTEPLKFELYESNIEPYLRFTHKADIQMSGWITASKICTFPDMSRCQHSYTTNYNNVEKYTSNEVCNLTLGSWDIEAFSYSSRYLGINEFPDPEKENDIITQIGTSLYKFNTKEKIKHVVTIKSPIDNDCDPVDGIIIETYNSEKELIEGWVKFILSTDPDILIQYNGYGFDWKYLIARAKVLGIEYILENLSRITEKPAIKQEDQLNTSAYGDNTMVYLKTFGITQFDMMFIIKKEHKLESYKLNSVAEHFTGDKKDDLSPSDLFNYNTSTKDKIALVVKYCAQDTWLLIDLILKLRIITNMIGMANITMVPMQYIELRGQQIRVHTQIAYETKKEGYLIPAVDYKPKDDTDEDEKFTGATVLDAKPGAHFEPIAGLDFASLYPSIMIAHNYDYATIVEDPEFDNLPGVEYFDMNWDEDDTDADGNEIKRNVNVRFVQNRTGIMPKILDRLWKERKAIRKQMKGLKDENLYAVLNGVQLAIKVSMNSIYGFTGAKYGRLPNKRIAAAVTACGREMIAHSKKCAEEWYDCEVVYGDTDSIYVKFNSDLKGQDHMDYVFKVAPECSDRISETFKKPIELEFEKVMYPFILFSKKRYASLFWTNPKSFDYIDYKGIQVVRRDNCEFVRENSKKIFEYILKNDKVLNYEFDTVEEVIETSKEYARDKIRKLVNSEVPMKQLLLSKSLRAGYAFDNKAVCTECDKTYYELSVIGKKEMNITNIHNKSKPEILDKISGKKEHPKYNINEFLETEHNCPSCKKDTFFKRCPANIPHVALARKRQERDKMDIVASGDRVPYVFVTYQSTKQFEKVEDPDYIIKNGIPIDYIYYFEHQFKSAIQTIFEPMMEDVTELWKDLIPEKVKKIRKKKTA
jgi:DNA polymerase delta subunit 1